MAFGAGTLTWQDPVHSWKAGPGEVMTVENKHTKLTYLINWNENENEEWKWNRDAPSELNST